MSIGKYSMTFAELAHYLKSSKRLKAELDFLLEYGVERLDLGMGEWKNVDKKSSFNQANPPYPYNEKNLYVNAANNLWYKSMWSFPPLDEMYYNFLLKRIRDFEKNEKFNFNKGIVYANLGVAQAAQMKLDEGFANILKALIEDSGYSSIATQYALFKRTLFTQFENRYVKEHLERIIPQLNLSGTSPVEQFLENFLKSLNDDQRAFFDHTFARIMQNWEIWKEKENGFTANRLLAYTQGFCLFNEDFLKSKTPSSVLLTRPHWQLKDLITHSFPSVNIRGCGANTIADLDRKLLSDLGRRNPQEKSLRILLTLRNYSSHNVSGGTSANCFYGHFAEIFAELIRAMCYIALLP